MITQAQIKQFQAISPKGLPSYMMPNYETIKEMLDITTDADDLNALGVSEDFDVFFKEYRKTVAAPKMTTSSTAVKTTPKKQTNGSSNPFSEGDYVKYLNQVYLVKAPTQKGFINLYRNDPKEGSVNLGIEEKYWDDFKYANKESYQKSTQKTVTATKGTLADKQAKARATAKTPSGNNTNAQKMLDKSNLQKSVQEKYELVKQNARFKNQIGEELTNYLKENRPRLGLGGLPIDYEIEQLKAKDRFYTNLLKNDKDDFKAIAKRLGLTFKTVANTATPSAYRKKDDKGKPMQAMKPTASKPDTRTAKQKDNDAWNWLK